MHTCTQHEQLLSTLVDNLQHSRRLCRSDAVEHNARVPATDPVIERRLNHQLAPAITELILPWVKVNWGVPLPPDVGGFGHPLSPAAKGDFNGRTASVDCSILRSGCEDWSNWGVECWSVLNHMHATEEWSVVKCYQSYACTILRPSLRHKSVKP